MKKALLFTGVIMWAVSFAYAQEVPKEPAQDNPAAVVKETKPLDTADMALKRTPLNKLVRGLMNSATFVCEVPAAIWDVSEKENPVLGWTVGTAQGVAIAFVRLGTGLFDTLTFAIPPYDKPLMEPEYAIDSAGEKMCQ